MSDDVVLSVVAPVYGCGDCLLALHSRLTNGVKQIADRYELVFVDDRGVEDGWAVLVALAREGSHVRAYCLSRNFGQDAAITAGLTQAAGEWTVVMDCDLQEAPEDIPRPWAAAGEGYDIVRTVRRGRRHSAFRRRTSRLYRRLTLETDVRPDYSNLSPLSRRVVDAFLCPNDPRSRVHDRPRLARGRLHRGRDRAPRAPRRRERLHAPASGPGRARRDVLRSTVLLRLVVLLGFVAAFAGVVVAGFEVADYFLEPEKSVPGYTSPIVLLLLLAGFIIVSVGSSARTSGGPSNRPLFLIDQQAAERSRVSRQHAHALAPAGTGNDLRIRSR